MTGTVLQVNVSRGGIPKRAIPSGELTAAGIAGDAWRYPFHGGTRKAILLVTIEGIDELFSQGFPLFPGALGENLTTRGLDRRALRLGQRLQVGDAAIELTYHPHAMRDARRLRHRHPGGDVRCARAEGRSRVAPLGLERLLRVGRAAGQRSPRRRDWTRAQAGLKTGLYVMVKLL